MIDINNNIILIIIIVLLLCGFILGYLEIKNIKIELNKLKEYYLETKKHITSVSNQLNQSINNTQTNILDNEQVLNKEEPNNVEEENNKLKEEFISKINNENDIIDNKTINLNNSLFTNNDDNVLSINYSMINSELEDNIIIKKEDETEEEKEEEKEDQIEEEKESLMESI